MIEKRTLIEFTCESKTLSTFLDAVTDTMTALQPVVPVGTPEKKSYTFPLSNGISTRANCRTV